MRRQPIAFLLAALAALLLLPAAASAQSSNPVLGTYRLNQGASDDVREAINTAVRPMNFITRPIARGRLVKTNEPYQRVVLAQQNGRVSTVMDDRAPIVTPADGTAIDWTREDGEQLKVSTRWVNGKLVQRFQAEDGARTNTYSVSPDGRTLTMDVLIESGKLPRPLTYKLVFDRT